MAGKKHAPSSLSTRKINVWIADDDLRYCSLVSRALNETKSVRCSHSFPDFVTLFSGLQAGTGLPDVILLDIRMPGTDGLDSIPKIKQIAASKIIILTAFDNDSYILKALAEGAEGFLLKGSSVGQITEAIQKVASGGVASDQKVLEKMFRILSHTIQSKEKYFHFLQDKENARCDSFRSINEMSDAKSLSSTTESCNLTEMERVIIRIAVKGGGQQEIADQLHRSVQTVHTHFKNIFWKLGVHSLHALVAKAILEELI